MLNLVFDTATVRGRFALGDETALLVERNLNVSGSYADALLPIVDEMLAEAGRRRTDLTAIGVTVGPGSFTGVRIGVATAKSLAWGLDCDLVGVTSLAAMAAALLREHPDAEVAVPALDARRGEVFYAVYARDGAWVTAAAEPAAANPDDAWQRVRTLLDDPDLAVFGGDGAALLLGQGRDLRAELSGRGRPVKRSWTAAHPATASALAVAMGAGAEQLAPIHPFALVPQYLRGSDAEVKRKVNLTPEVPNPQVSIHHSDKADRS